MPAVWHWDEHEVGEWIEAIGFGEYRPHFEGCLVTGRKLVKLDASHLPQLGVSDFAHVKVIAKGKVIQNVFKYIQI